MTALERILEWSSSRSEIWMQDALRRLIALGILSRTDKDEIFELFLHQNGLLESAPTFKATPLSAEHLPATTGGAGPVSIIQMGPLTGVNALAPDQLIELSISGLNVIYGRNASGKSGYSRVLKKACRARDSEEQVLGNVFSSSPGPGPRAEFLLAVGTSKVSVTWTPEQAPEEMAGIAVFDSRCARLYVDKAGEVAFLPYGLDVFPALCELMDEFAERLALQIRQLEANPIVLPRLPENTEAAGFLKALSGATGDAGIEVACAFDKQRSDRLEALVIALAKNPEEEAKHLRRLAERLSALIEPLALIRSMTEGKEAKASVLQERALAARKAIDYASADAFHDCPLSGVGSDAWRILYQAAEKFSMSEAYPGDAYPCLSDDARCVLCQQVLDGNARDRFTRFKEFVAGEAEMSLRGIESEIRESLSRLSSRLALISSVDDTLLDEIAEFDRTLSDHLRSLRAQCAISLQEAAGGLERINLAALANSANAMQDMASLISKLEAEAASKLAGLDRDSRLKLTQEATELDALKQLAINRETVTRQRDQLAYRSSLQKARDSLGTRTITMAGNVIAEAAITTELAKSMTEALDELGLTDLPIKVKHSGGKGSFLTSLALDGCAAKVDLSSVLSEGEQRSIALAAFISELRLADHKNAVVFDDPVSSLDHNHREHLAKCLAKLARERQVIIFTHDIVFLKDLETHAEQAGISFAVTAVRQLSRDSAGIASPSALPTEMLPLNAHIEAIQARLALLRQEYSMNGDSCFYHEGVREWYGLLREAWEKAIEEVLFFKVVQSFADKVMTQNLREVAVDDSDWLAVLEAIAKTSAQLQGHRKSAVRNPQIPIPEEMQVDIEALRGFVDRVKSRRKDLRDRRPRG
jgi:hypothetical protein